MCMSVRQTEWASKLHVLPLGHSIAQWSRAEVLEFEALQDADSMDFINPEVLGNFSNLSELSLSHLHNGDNKITL